MQIQAQICPSDKGSFFQIANMTRQSVQVYSICNTWKNRKCEENILSSIHKQPLILSTVELKLCTDRTNFDEPNEGNLATRPFLFKSN